jgi:hypothetical protein
LGDVEDQYSRTALGSGSLTHHLRILVVELGVETKLSKTVDPDGHGMDSLLVWGRGAPKAT